MQRIVFASTATQDLSDQQIADIAGAHHRAARRSGLTGVMIAHQGRFFFVLEGDESMLGRRMRAVQQDQRHDAITLIDSSEISMRAFANWSFVYERPENMPILGNEKVHALAEIVPINSPLRGSDLTVRHHVRDFLASFTRLLAAA